MCRKKSEKTSGKKWLAIALLMAVVVSSLGSGMTTMAATKKKADVTAAKKTEVKKAYGKFAKKLQKKTGKKLYYAMTNASANGMPILLISDQDEVFGRHKKQAIAAKVYSYSAGKVVYVTKMQSTGTAYPLLKNGQYILSGWHHVSYQLKVSGKKGHMKSVSGMYMYHSAKCYQSSWIVINGKKSNLTKKKISSSKAESLDYYGNIKTQDYNGRIIIFQKVS